MSRMRPSRTVLPAALLALALALPAGPGARAAVPDSARPAAVAQAAPARLRPAAPTDSARRAYRAWLRRLRARAVADSIARADSVARADSLTRADSLAGRGPGVTAAGGAVTRPDYVAQVKANFTAENRGYAFTRQVLWFLDPLWGILVGLFMLFSGLSAGLRNVAHGLGHRGYVRALVYLALYFAAAFVLTFPLTYFEGFALEHQYRLSTLGFGPWLGEQIVGTLIALGFLGVVPLVHLAYRAVRRFPRAWWLVLAACTLPVILAGAFLEPLVIDPAFNRFTPLQDRTLEARILAVTGRVGIPARHVYQADKSRQTVKYNAYVNGFGPSQRVVLWDTTLKGMTPDEILVVVAHEAAHYRLHHMWWGLLMAAGLSFPLLWLSAAFMSRAARRWGRRWGFTELHDLASLPLFVVAITLFSTLAQPVVNAVSCRMEHDADTFALEVTHDNDAAARAFIKLGAQNRSDPDPSPFIEVVQYTHPPLLDRVRFATGYRPWEQGQPNRLYHPAAAAARR